ncbi:serine/threonine protein kinase [Thalassoglobus polymorphus]|uniref:Serine/threonine-protein kinase PrkC n=1 Tax=Thalassoglobus polymorphus TaxID=2527994 RepID=A0A517QUU8_9PLAN|nr:serine/threonine-protein kinase [Thalassoglobus polymorphus]QDT35415.1 Serine/threonine-protein kinase PrkC [Thalassoglobus polymorphus]
MNCPQCLMPVPSADISLLQTMLWKSSPDWAHATPTDGGSKKDQLDELVGKTLDKYRVESLLGRGGMGWVFLSRHLQLNRSCAIKVLSPSLLDTDPDYLDRFCTEGQAAASMVHPNIVTVHAIGQHGGLNFLEMEFVPGRSLQNMLRTGRLMIWRATTLALGIANGLGAAHRLGIIHRDLKPDNVLLTHHGIPKISDFGLAKRVHGNVVHEMPGVLAGTPHFMAPELFGGESASPASDVYALGVCFYYMLTGRLPFPRRKMSDLISAVTTERAPSLRELRPEVPLEVCECLGLMMEKSPRNRPRDGIEAAQLLQAVLGQVRDLDTLLHEAFDHERDVRWKKTEDDYRINVSLADGRKQVVFLSHSEHRFHERLLQIYSVCCPAETHYFPAALRLNSVISHGALAIREINGEEFFVISNAYPRSTVDGEEIRKSVLEIATHADAVESLLTGQDVN